MADINVGELVNQYWISNRQTKRTPSGWISGNAVCCHHRGHSPDKRKRGGLLLNHDGSFAYSCFNCGFNASWSPGKLINSRCKSLFNWLSISEMDKNIISFQALRLHDNHGIVPESKTNVTFDTVYLPDGVIPIDNNTPIQVLEYIVHRHLEPFVDTLYYNKTNHLQLTIPLYHHTQLTGWLSRNLNDKIRYSANVQPGYVYGLSDQIATRKLAFVTEGVIDAMHIGGVSVLGSSINQAQRTQIESLNRDIVLVPDRDNNGKKMTEWAINNDWLISFPQWDHDINDVSDAVSKYGRLATFGSIMNGICQSRLKSQLLIKSWFGN